MEEIVINQIKEQVRRNGVLRLRQMAVVNGVVNEWGPLSTYFAGWNIDNLTAGRLFVYLFSHHRDYSVIVYDTAENEARVKAFQPKKKRAREDNVADTAAREFRTMDRPDYARSMILWPTILWYGCYTEAEKDAFIARIDATIVRE